MDSIRRKRRRPRRRSYRVNYYHGRAADCRCGLDSGGFLLLQVVQVWAEGQQKL